MGLLELFNSLPKRSDVTPEELAARRQGYADLYQGGLLARNRDQTPLSVRAAQASQDFIPGISDAIALKDAYDAASRGELAAAGLLGMGAVVGLAPGAGDMVARPIMAAGRRLRGSPSVSQAASDTYLIGDRLAAPSGFSGPSGKPSEVGILGEKFEARPISAIETAASDYMRSRGIDDAAMSSYPAFSEERARLIASLYDQMKHDPQNPAVRRAYDAMIGETLDQYNALKNSGIDFKFIPEGMDDPYALTPALGYKDLVENGRLWVFPTDQGFGSSALDVSDNPLLKRVGQVGDLKDATANDAFRAVHDTFGHFGPGNPFFRRQGEERAFLEHQRMYSPEARGAMTSETRGQNSWLNSGPLGAANRNALGGDTVFADQKTGLLSDWAASPTGMPSTEEKKMLQDYIRSQGWEN